MIRPMKPDGGELTIQIVGSERYHECNRGWNFSIPARVLWFGDHKEAWRKCKQAILKAIKEYEK